MKKMRTFVVATVLILTIAATAAGRAGQSNADKNAEKEVMDAENRITAAYLAKNIDGFFQDSDPGMTAFHASNPYRVDDRKQISDALKTFFKDSTCTGLYKLQPHIQIYGDTAIVTYHFVETGDAEKGKLYAYDGKQTDVFIKRNGKWTLVHFHSSRVVKPS